jgi:hypothetical protein
MISARCPACDWEYPKPVESGTKLFCEECGKDFEAVYVTTPWIPTTEMARPVMGEQPSSSPRAVLDQAACPTPISAMPKAAQEMLSAPPKPVGTYPLELSLTFNYVLLAGARGSCQYTLRNTTQDTLSRIRLILDSDAFPGGPISIPHDPLHAGEVDADPIDLGTLSPDIHGNIILKCTLEVGTQAGIRTAEGKLPGVVILPATASAREIRLQIGDNFALGAEGVNFNLGNQDTDHDLLQRCIDDAPARSVALKERGHPFVEDLPHHFINSLQMELVRVPVGTRSAWFCHHQVTQLNWFNIMRTTQEQQLAKKGSHHCGLDPRIPVYGVNLEEARDFCQKLNQHEQNSGNLPPGYHYRLPTEAEWRAASGPSKYTDRELQHHAWTMLAKVDGPQLVGCLRPNEFGLYDMRGNVFEWCEADSPTADKAPVYGGSWYADPQGADLEAARQGSRILCPVGTRSSRIGLRVVLAPRL